MWNRSWRPGQSDYVFCVFIVYFVWLGCNCELDVTNEVHWWGNESIIMFRYCLIVMGAIVNVVIIFVFCLMFPLQESLQQQQNGVEWTILSQGSRELEGLLKLVSKERLQLERNFVLATQVCKSELIFIGMFRLFFCWFWKNSGSLSLVRLTRHVTVSMIVY